MERVWRSICLLTRLQEENLKLRKTLRRETDRYKASLTKTDELGIANEQMLKEIVGLRKLVSKVDTTNATKDNGINIIEEINHLKDQVKEKERMIQELMNPEQNETARLNAENRKLKREVEMWNIRVSKLTDELSKHTSSKKMDAIQDKFEALQSNIPLIF